jgi:hypothetical protein
MAAVRLLTAARLLRVFARVVAPASVRPFVLRAFVLFVAGVVSMAPLPCAAAPFAVQVGDARLGMDAPPGFADTGFTGSPRLQELAETLTSASNRILMFAISDADLRRFTVGDQIEAKRYMVAVTPRGLERERITAAAFTTLVNDSLRGLGAPPPAGTADYRKFLDAQQGRPALLAELRRDPETVSVLTGARLLSEGRFDAPKYMLTTTTLLLVRGKAINLGVFGTYESPEDLDWIRVITARWVEELQRLNSR